MPKAPRPWIVTRHDPIEELDDNLWAVEGDVPDFPAGTGMPRRMSVVRMDDGRLVFYNAIPLDEAALAKVRAWGKPSILIVPVFFHSIDAKAFQEKLGLSVFTSKITLEKTRASIPGARPLEELPQDASLQCVPLSGTRFGESAFVVKSGPRATLLFCDVFQNSRPGRGFGGFMFKIMGFTGNEPKTPPFYKLRAATDKAAIKKDLLRLADTPGLVRLVPSHGIVVSENAASVLRATATKYL
jgi:hypothetical protein